MTKYNETKIYTSSQGVEPIIARLMEFDLEHFSIDDPNDVREIILNKDEGEWDYIDPSLLEGSDEAIISFYTENTAIENAKLENIKEDLKKLKNQEEKYGLSDIDFGRMSMETTPLQDDWKDKWKETFRPFSMTDTFVIKPTWENYLSENNEKIIEIDPGMAFGTGSHETTRSCVELLEKNLKEGNSVLDIGSGSGILSIVSILLGAETVTAVEVDETAMDVSRENFKLNNVDENIDMIVGDIRDIQIDIDYDIIVANLSKKIFKQIGDKIAASLKASGIAIAAGFLDDDIEEIKGYFIDAGLKEEEIIRKGEWATISFSKI